VFTQRLTIASLILGLAATTMGTLPAMGQESSRLPDAPPANNVRARRAWAKLTTTKITLDFDDAPVLDVFKFLRQTSGVNLVLDGQLRNSGELDDKRVSLEVTDIPLRSALSLVLEFTELAATWKHGVLFITTPDRARGETVLRLYDVRDITWKMTNFPGPSMELASGSGMDDSGLSFPGDDDDTSSVPTQDEIVDLITSMLSEAFEAPKTAITQLGGQLLVRQDARTHRQVREILGQLRAAR
jgi:hypothetical protein